jgi:hypothetical protein
VDAYHEAQDLVLYLRQRIAEEATGGATFPVGAIREALKGTPGEGVPYLDDAVSVLAKAWRDEAAVASREKGRADAAFARALRERDIAEEQTRRADAAEERALEAESKARGALCAPDGGHPTTRPTCLDDNQQRAAELIRSFAGKAEVESLTAQLQNRERLLAAEVETSVERAGEIESLTARLEQMRGRAEEAELQLRQMTEVASDVPEATRAQETPPWQGGPCQICLGEIVPDPTQPGRGLYLCLTCSPDGPAKEAAIELHSTRAQP